MTCMCHPDAPTTACFAPYYGRDSHIVGAHLIRCARNRGHDGDHQMLGHHWPHDSANLVPVGDHV